MNKVIKKSNAVTLMANPKIELEVKYTNTTMRKWR